MTPYDWRRKKDVDGREKPGHDAEIPSLIW
jgi:hypothetical protein